MDTVQPRSVSASPSPRRSPGDRLLRVLRSSLPVGGILVGGLSGGFLSGCTSSVGESLVVTGSSTLAPLVEEAAPLFEERHPGVRVEVQAGGSSRGISDVTRGLAHVGMSTRPLGRGEQGLVSLPLALDGVAIVVHAENSVMGLSREQVVALFSGKILDWAQVGGDSNPVTVVQKAEGRGTLHAFMEWTGLNPAQLSADVVVGENQHGVKTVAGNPGAVAYVSVSAVAAERELGTPVRHLLLEGVAPTRDAVRSGTYPLVRTLDLVIQPEADSLALAFVEFLRSEAVHHILERMGLVPLDR